MVQLILFTVLIGGGYIEESTAAPTTLEQCEQRAKQLNKEIKANDYQFYYCYG